MKVKDRLYNRVLDDKDLDKQVVEIVQKELEDLPELPNTDLANAGDILVLDESKDPKWETPEEPTEVVANPTLAGTESPLTGLQVGNTKYKVSGGTKLYKHSINFMEGAIITEYYSYDNTPNTLLAISPIILTSEGTTTAYLALRVGVVALVEGLRASSGQWDELSTPFGGTDTVTEL